MEIDNIDKNNLKGLLSVLEDDYNIKWDRIVEIIIKKRIFITVYGWIYNTDKDKDFILIEFMKSKSFMKHNSKKGMLITFMSTSSKKYSEILSKELGFEEHNDCIKYTDYFKGCIKNES